MEMTLIPELPDLRVLRQIGSGATAQVYEACRKESGERVALKVVSLQSLEDESARRRAKREAVALQSLRHPGVVRLFQFFETEESLILELEFVDGCTLTEWIQRNQIPLIEPKLWILANLAQALASAHSVGTIHRDLKPDNVLISKEGEVKLTDFGLAKQPQLDRTVTQPGLLVGSLAYMAPEMLSEGESTFASDSFSFGIIAYELLTGRHPFPGQDVRSLVEGLCRGGEALTIQCSPSLPEGLGATLLRCLDRDPKKRPESLWTVYAELMVSIHESGLQDLCKPLVGTRAVEDGALSEALHLKYQKLKAGIEEESRKPDLNRKKLVRWINEFTLLFPDNREVSNYLLLLREKNPSPILKRASIAALVLALLCAAYPLARRISRVSLPAPAPSVPSQAVAKAEAPRQGVLKQDGLSLNSAPLTDVVASSKSAPVVAPFITQASVLPSVAPISATPASVAPRAQIVSSAPVAAKKARKAMPKAPPSPAMPGTGTLDARVSPDIRVFVDGKRYGTSELHSIPLSEGSHQILLERDGYLPIEKTISIKKGNVTTIQVGEVAHGH